MGRRVVAVLLAVGVGGVLSGVLTGCGAFQQQERFSDDAKVEQAVRGVRLDTDSGSVRISVGETASVHRDVGYGGSRPGSTFRVEGDELVLSGCGERNCWVDYTVVVPEGVRVLGESSSGDVEVRGAAAVDVRSASGSVTVREVGGPVRVAASSGSVELVDTGDTVAVEADSGDITIRAAKAAGVAAHASSGSIQVTVPRGAYRVSARSDSGEVDNRVGDDLGAANHLDLDANSGDITIGFA